MMITRRQALRLLANDFKLAKQAVARHIRVPLTPQQHHALASFVYNVGETQFKQSSVVKHLNNGRLIDSAMSMQKYVYASNGQPLEGLRRRRLHEVALLLKG